MFPFCHFGSFSSWGAWGWGGMIAGMLLWAALVVGLILLVVWLFRRSTRSQVAAPSSSATLSALKERYARGEISREEYYRILEELQ